MGRARPPSTVDLRYGLNAWFGCVTEFKQAKLGPTFAVLAAVGILLAFAPSALAAEGGQITGKVTAASSKAAIAGIEVCAAESLFEGELYGHCATANSSGEYSISGLPAGSYGVGFFAPEGSGLNYMPQFYNGKSSVSEAELLAVEAGHTVSGINAAMQVGGQITGKVTGASSKVAVGGIQACASQNGGEAFACAKANSSGEYTVSGLATGSYTVSFSSPEGSGLNYISQYYNAQSTYGEANPVSVTAGSTTSGIDAAMAAGGQITGKVTSAAGSTAVANVQVSVYEASGTYATTYATTNSSGEYTVSGLHTGEYKVQFTPEYGSGNYLGQYYKGQSSLEAAEAIGVTVEKTTSEINAKLQTGGQITGKVTNASTKADLEGIEVCPSATSGILYAQCVTTNPSGEYTIIGLPTSEYKVEFYTGANFVTQYYNAKPTPTEANAISVIAGATTSGIDAAMVVGGQMTGKVTSATTKSGLGTVNVCASSTGGGLGACATTNANGEYAIVGLAAGEYRVEFSLGYSCGSSGCTPPNYLAQYYSARSSLSEADSVSVATGATTSGIDAAMVEAGKVTGKVTNSASKAVVSGIEVCPQTVSGGYVEQCTTTNSNGEYTITGLSPGEYKIEFYSNSGAYFTQYYNGKTSVSEASVIAVSAASTTSGIDAAMVEGGKITGKVTSAASKAGIEGVQICAETQTFFGQCATTNAAGEYTLSGLSSGEYSVRFEPNSGNYLSQYYNDKSAKSEATLVAVADSTTTSGINAALAAGGQIKGTVTSAATKAAVADIEVCAESHSGEFFQRCATTTETGEYDIEGLPTGEYVVSFFLPTKVISTICGSSTTTRLYPRKRHQWR